MPFCTSCGAEIETGTKCDACLVAVDTVSPEQAPPSSQIGLGNWLNEMLVTFKNLLTGNPEEDWVMNNSQAAIWGAIVMAAVLMGIVVMLLASSTNRLLHDLFGFYSFAVPWFSAPKAFFLGFLGMAVLIVALFGTLYVIMAVSKSMATSWNLLGLAAYAGLFLAVVLLLALLGGKITGGLGLVLFIFGWVAHIQILNQGLNHISDINRSVTFYAVPLAIAVSLILLYIYIRIWINW